MDASTCTNVPESAVGSSAPDHTAHDAPDRDVVADAEQHLAPPDPDSVALYAAALAYAHARGWRDPVREEKVRRAAQAMADLLGSSPVAALPADPDADGPDFDVLPRATRALELAAFQYLNYPTTNSGDKQLTCELRTACGMMSHGNMEGGISRAAIALAPYLEPEREAHRAALKRWRDDDKLRRATVPPDLAEIVALATMLMHGDHARFRDLLGEARCLAEYLGGALGDARDAMVGDARSRALPMPELLQGQVDAVRERAQRHEDAKVRDAAAIMRHDRLLADWSWLGSRLIDHPTRIETNDEDGMSRLQVATKLIERTVMSDAIAPAAELAICDWFEGLCRDAVHFAGDDASLAIWHVLIADDHGFVTPSDSRSWLMDEIDGDDKDREKFYAACRHYAYVTSIGLPSWQTEKLLNLVTADEDAIAAFAPFNHDRCDDDGAGILDGIRQIAADFMLAGDDNAAISEALGQFAYRMGLVAREHAMTPVFRMGMIAWLVGRLDPEQADDLDVAEDDDNDRAEDDGDQVELDEATLDRLRTVQASGTSPAVTRALVAEIDRLRTARAS